MLSYCIVPETCRNNSEVCRAVTMMMLILHNQTVSEICALCNNTGLFCFENSCVIWFLCKKTFFLSFYLKEKVMVPLFKKILKKLTILQSFDIWDSHLGSLYLGYT